MRVRERIVVDTNALISRLLMPGSVPGRAVRKAVDEAQLRVSEPTMHELAEVLARPKFDPYVTVAERQEFLRVLGRIAEMVPIVYTVHACRDPRDDKFLELAVNGEADLIVTGDDDLSERPDTECCRHYRWATVSVTVTGKSMEMRHVSASIKSLGIDRLPVEERLALVEEIWDSIAADGAAVPPTETQRAELQKRIEEDDAQPDDLIPWERVKASTLSRLGK